MASKICLEIEDIWNFDSIEAKSNLWSASPKKRTDEFVLFAFLLFMENKSNSSVQFLGESTARQSAFRFYLTFSLDWES